VYNEKGLSQLSGEFNEFVAIDLVREREREKLENVNSRIR
jgi:hypothetical protein